MCENFVCVTFTIGKFTMIFKTGISEFCKISDKAGVSAHNYDKKIFNA